MRFNSDIAIQVTSWSGVSAGFAFACNSYALSFMNSGWYFNLPYVREKQFTKAVLAGDSLIFTTYQPTGDVCNAEGLGFLYATDYRAGIAGEYGALGKDPSKKRGDAELAPRQITIGPGSPSAPTIYYDSAGNSRAIIQTSTGAIISEIIAHRTNNRNRRSWREIKVNW